MRPQGARNRGRLRVPVDTVSASSGRGLVLVVNKAMRAGTKLAAGASAHIALAADTDERPAETPKELEKEFAGNRRLKHWYLGLSPSMRREIAKWIREPKSEASRQNRAGKMAERLLGAMEGEIELPPVLQVMFQALPMARAGWEALTPLARRNHLLGIFYYESSEARERRAAKAVDAALAKIRPPLMER